MKPVVIVLIILGVLILIGGAGFLLYQFVFKKNILRKQIRELDSKFQYLHALLIGQDSQYVKRFEIISRTNLLYVDIHTKYLKRFKEVRDKHDSHAQATINHLKDLADEKKYKMLKEALVDARDQIASFDKEVNSLNNDLVSIIRPEEECRQESIHLKERLRALKKDYDVKKVDLSLVSDSFDEVFKYIDSQFEEFENYVECAQYDDANNILPKIDKILRELSNAIVDLPNLCAMVMTLIPEKIVSLENAYEVMRSQDYPLHHLCVTASIEEIRETLDKLTTRIKRFDLDGVGDKLNDIYAHLEEFFRLFEDEKKAREVFEHENDTTYSMVNTVERNFIKLCNTIPEVSEIFVINEEHQNKINQIQNNINKLGALKRSLDTFIHSSTKQPYSLLVSKMHELDDASNAVIKDMDEFQHYLASLKTDSEAAYNLIFEFFYKVKAAEKKVSDIGVNSISEKYAPKFDEFYDILNTINNLLLAAPIDVDKVNDNVSKLHELNNAILDEGSIAQDYNMMVLAENSILFINRDRHHLSDIDDLGKQAESLFEQGEFEQSYRVSGNALTKIHSLDHAKR